MFLMIDKPIWCRYIFIYPLPRSDLGSHGGRKAIARCPCTPQGHMEARGEKINVSSGPSKEIAGLKKNMMMMMMMMMKMMTPGSQNSRVWEFSHEALEVCRSPLGLCLGTYGPLECSGEFLKPS